MLSTPFPSISNPGLKSRSSRKPCWLSSPLNDYPLLISIFPVSITKHLLYFIYVVSAYWAYTGFLGLPLSQPPTASPPSGSLCIFPLPARLCIIQACALPLHLLSNRHCVPIVLPVHNPVNPLRPGSKDLFSRNHLWPLASQRWFLPPHPLGGSGV